MAERLDTPRLTQYATYRAFLEGIHTHRKRQLNHWSYGAWARKLRLKSSSTLIMIVKGARNPSDALTQSLVDDIGLKGNDRELFFDMVQLEKQKKSVPLTAVLQQRIRTHRPSTVSIQVALDQFAALSNTVGYTLRELIRLGNFREDVSWIAKRLRYRVSPLQIRTALKMMVRLGILQRNSAGVLTVVHEHIETSPAVASKAIRSYHTQVFDNAKTSLEEVPPEKREILGTSFPMKSTKIEESKKTLREFLQTFCDTYENTEGDEVFQLQLALFPLTRQTEGE